METEPTDARMMRDDELNEALAAHAAEELGGLSIENRRLERIQEYEEAALSRPDPFAAVIGLGNASLQRVFEHLGKALLDAMDGHPHTVDELRELSPEIRLLVKLRKLIETDLAIQPSDAGQQVAAFPHAMQGKRLDTKIATGKRDLLPRRWTRNP